MLISLVKLLRKIPNIIFLKGREGGPSEINYVRSLFYKRGGVRPKSNGCGCKGFHSFGFVDVHNFISQANKFSQFRDF